MDLKNLITNDISRCNDYKCPTAAFCARFKQLSIDLKTRNKAISVTNFKECEKNGLCDYFLNADVIAEEENNNASQPAGMAGLLTNNIN